MARKGASATRRTTSMTRWWKVPGTENECLFLSGQVCRSQPGVPVLICLCCRDS
jgi:hypothetical protein